MLGEEATTKPNCLFFFVGHEWRAYALAMNVFRLALMAILLLWVTGCREKPAEQTASSPAADAAVTNARPITGSTNVFFHLVRGVVRRIDAEEMRISIQHDEIPNFMPAMTMPFRVKDATELEKVQPGDTIFFRLWVTPDESWVDKLTKVADPASNVGQTGVPPQREAVRVVRDVEPLSVGDLMPDYQFTNELGRVVRFSDFKDQALAFTFLFTRCPLPEFCPRMSHNFQEVYKKLNAMPNAPTNWHLFSISFDPHFDTPAVLRSYAQAFEADPERWNFLTGAMEKIDAITDQFELTIVKRGNEWDHKLRTVVVDAHGRIQKIIFGNEWQPDALVEEIVKAATVPRESTAQE
jgi:protein SCO1/2